MAPLRTGAKLHWTTHVITGAALGYSLGHRVPATLAGLASHLVLDIVPHHDPESDAGYVIDTLLGSSALAALCLLRITRRQVELGPAIWGAVGAALPDVELAVKLLKDLDSEQLVFPTHNGTVPHLQTALMPSLLAEAALVPITLIPVALKVLSRGLRPAGEPGARGG